MATQIKVNKCNRVRFSEYNGNDLVQFGEPDQRYPLQFGRGKAEQLIDAIDEDGLYNVLAHIYAVAGYESVPSHIIKKPASRSNGKKVTTRKKATPAKGK